MSLTITDIERMELDDRWSGWGYVMERRLASETRREIADRLVLEIANSKNMTYEQLFQWANSKPGRWFMEEVTSHTSSVEDIKLTELHPSS